MVCGLGRDQIGYVLEDATIHTTPERWANRVALAYNRWRADCVVAEVNNEHALVTHVLNAAQTNLPVRTANASRGKITRAEPVASLYEAGRVRHVGPHAQLKDECCTWVPGMAGSPDRLDALVWGLSQLMLGAGVAFAPIFKRRESRWAPLQVRRVGRSTRPRARSRTRASMSTRCQRT